MSAFQWVPCTEKMPNKYGYYMVTIKLINSDEIEYKTIEALYSIDDSFNVGFCQSSWPYEPVYNVCGTKWAKVDVIAWAQYPEPYII